MAEQKKKPYIPPPLGMLGMKIGGLIQKVTGGTKTQDIKPGGGFKTAAPKPVPKTPSQPKSLKPAAPPAGPPPLRIEMHPYRNPDTKKDDPHIVVLKVSKKAMDVDGFEKKLHDLGVELAVGHAKIITGEKAHIAFVPKTSAQAAMKANPGVIVQGAQHEPIVKWTSAGCVVIPDMVDREHVYVIKPANNFGPWAFPKGTVDKGESIKQAAIREVLEETGLHVQILPGKGAYLGKAEGSHSFTHYFLAVRTGGAPRPTEETEKVSLVTWDEAKHLFKSSGNKRDGNVADLARQALKQFE